MNFKFAKMIREPWLSWIINGPKTHEGRINDGDWADLKIGDYLHFYSDINGVDVQVTDLKYYPSFGAAWIVLGEELVPNAFSDIPLTSDAVDVIYSKLPLKHELLPTKGVVAVKVKIIP